MKAQQAAQVFALMAIAVGLLVSYLPPAHNADAIWALVGGFLGYAAKDLFAAVEKDLGVTQNDSPKEQQP